MPQIHSNCGMCVTEEETTTYTGLRDIMEITNASL